MPRIQIPELKLDPFHLIGSSTSGIATSFYIKDLSLCFDVANGLEPMISAKNFLITHGHLDHIGGLPYILSQRAMRSLPETKVYVPGPLRDPLDEVLQGWQKIEGHQYNYQLIGTEEDKTYPLKGKYHFKIFPTIHRVACNGYTVFETKKKLKDEFKNSGRDEILKAKEKGLPIEDESETPILSFTGDTEIEFLDLCPWVKKSKYLMMECSFLDEKRSVTEAKKWGHTHLDELAPRLPELECEKVVIIHISQRYSEEMAKEIIEAKIPKEFHEKIVISSRAWWKK